MANSIEDQLHAFGVAQVLVFLKPTISMIPSGSHSLSAALATSVPVVASAATTFLDDSVVEVLGKHFRTSELSSDAALSGARTQPAKSRRAAKWVKAANDQSKSTPAARIYPNLGIMLGTVDQAGLDSLANSEAVAKVCAPPVLSLIQPTAVAANPSPAPEYTWGIKYLKADLLHAQKITGKGVIVGHLDTGIDGKHPALKKAIHAFAHFDNLGFEVTPTPQPFDSGDHGSHTAGTIAGRTIRGRAIGVAPGAMLASACVIEGGNAIARILAGMDWIIGQKARILNMSLGFRGYTEDFLSLTQVLRLRGVLPIFAVGNEGPGSSRSPGNYEETLSVGAMHEGKKVADFSSSRQFERTTDPIVPDVVGPGVAVISAKPGGGYQEMDGTSMATPHIAGLAALLMQAEPTKTIDQVEAAIFKSCRRLTGEAKERQNRGVPDAVKALRLLSNL